MVWCHWDVRTKHPARGELFNALSFNGDGMRATQIWIKLGSIPFVWIDGPSAWKLHLPLHGLTMPGKNYQLAYWAVGCPINMWLNLDSAGCERVSREKSKSSLIAIIGWANRYESNVTWVDGGFRWEYNELFSVQSDVTYACCQNSNVLTSCVLWAVSRWWIDNSVHASFMLHFSWMV